MLQQQPIVRSLIIALGLIAPEAWAADTPAKPNVVILLADDLGWNAVSYHGDWCETPNIDSIASQGLELDRFYVAPMCSPTRAGLLTGRYPIRFGLARAVIPPQRDMGLPPEERTLAEALGEAGYTHRGIFGKWHLGHHRLKWHPLNQGFTHFQGHYNGAIDYFDLSRDGERDWHVNFEPSQKQGYSTDLIGEAAAAFIRESAQADAPYFCYVPFNAPHAPFQAKEEDIRRFDDGGKVTEQEIYRAMIWSMDQAVGKILAAIADSGEADNTQVWFMSDNGGVAQFKSNNAPLRGAKLTTFDGGIRVAACVRWPAGWKGGRKIDAHMGYIDLLPTILSTAGVKPSEIASQHLPLDGIDVSPVLAGTADQLPPRDWYSYHGQSGLDSETLSVHASGWKLQLTGPDIRSGRLTEQHTVNLFKLPDDLLEKNDLAEQYPEVVERLFKQLVAYRLLQPENAVPQFNVGREGFKPWKNWDIRGRN